MKNRIIPGAVLVFCLFVTSCKKQQDLLPAPQTQIENSNSLLANNLHLNAGIHKNAAAKQFTLRWATNDSTLKIIPRVVGLGSSTLVGYGLDYPDRLCDKIVSWLVHRTYKPYWVNKAVYGNSSAKILPVAKGGIAGQNIETALSLNPDFIFLSLPSNDAASGIPVSVTLANFRLIDSIAFKRGVPVFFETTQPRNSTNINMQVELKQLADSIRKDWPLRYVEGFRKVVDKTAPTPAAILPKYNQGDGIHLTGDGNQFIANSLFETWQNYFKPINGVSKYIVEASGNKVTWKLFDVINNGNVVKKTYNNNLTLYNYYRVQAVFTNGTKSAYSNVVN